MAAEQQAIRQGLDESHAENGAGGGKPLGDMGCLPRHEGVEQTSRGAWGRTPSTSSSGLEQAPRLPQERREAGIFAEAMLEARSRKWSASSPAPSARL